MLANFKNLKKVKLQTIIFAIFSILLGFAIIITGLSSYHVFESKMVEQLAKSRVDLLAQVSAQLNALERVIISYSDLFYYNEPIKSKISKTSIDNTTITNELNSLNDQYSKAMVTNGVSLYYTIFTYDGFTYNSQLPQKKIDVKEYIPIFWKYDASKLKGSMLWLPTYKDIWDVNSQNNYVLSCARPLYDDEGNAKGFFLVNTPEEAVRNIYAQSLNQNNSISVVSSEGQIISHRDKNMVGFYFYRMDRLGQIFADNEYAITEKNGEKYLFSRYYNKDLGWYIFEEIPMKQVLMPLKGVKILLLFSYTLMLVVVFVLSYFLSKWLASPLKSLCTRLKMVAYRDDKISFDINGWSEIQEICDECTSMNNRIYQLIENVKDRESKIRESELEFLLLQINPHFIHNTLFSLKCLISMGKSREAENMLTDFSSLLASTFRSNDQLITIEQELSILNKYVEVQKYRYGNKFTLNVICSRLLVHCKVPKLLMQPIIENSIFHGIEPCNRPGYITVKISRSDDNIILIISDNGIGFEQTDEPLKQITNNIGIENVQNRIKLLFGSKYGLHIESKVNVGTNVCITLPYLD